MQLIEQDNWIKVPGGTIWSQKIFSERVQNEIPLIVMHGGPGSTHNTLKYAFKSLAEYFPIIVYDQLGSGNSKLETQDVSNTSLWKIERFVEELQCLINFYQLEHINLFGTSWGAALALEYIFTQHKNIVKRLIMSSPLVSTQMWIQDMHRLRRQLPQNIQDILNYAEQNQQTDSHDYKMAEEIFEDKHVLRKELLNDDQLEVLNNNGKFNFDAYKTMWGINEFYPSGTLLNYNRFDDLKHLQIPTLFTCGEFDEVMPQTLELFHKEVANSQIEVLKNCSHRAAFENPTKYCEIVHEFLS